MKLATEKLLRQWGEITTPYPRHITVHQAFSEAVARFPDKTALVLPNDNGETAESLTYAELDAQTDRLASLLAAQGVRPGDRVAFLLDRTMVPTLVILATLKAGAAYVPVDPSYPIDRIRYMLGETAVRLIVTSTPWLKVAEASGLGGIVLNDRAELVQAFGTPGEVAPDPVPASPAEATAYIMFTSGSTGKPKGVCVRHRAIVRLVRNSTYTPMDPDKVFLQLSAVSFDPHTLELWAGLLNGGRCVLYPGSSLPDPEILGRIITRQGVTFVWLTTSLFNTLIQEVPGCLQGVQELMVGGEALSIPHIRMAHDHLPDVQMINGYGPTESTYTTCYRIPRPVPESWTSIPIGTPIENTEVYVLDDKLKLVPVGEPGELCIGGDALAAGYFGRPELTAEKFVAHPLSSEPGARIYRSGDRVRWLESGQIEFLGRVDDQVKINGFRIELGEVKAALLESPDVVDAYANVQDVGGQRRLVGYYVPRDPATTSDRLEAFLKDKVPAAFVPTAWVAMKAFPLTAHGKIDHKALPAATKTAAPSSAAPPVDAGDLEARLAALWAELLGIGDVALDVPFFQLGGTSLLAIRMVGRIKAQIGPAVPIADVFKHTTVRALAAHLASRSGASPLPSGVPSPSVGADEPIAVVGMAGRFPGAKNLEEFWQVLLDGRAPLTHFKAEDLDPGVDPGLANDPDYVMARGILEGIDLFDAAYFGILPREAEVMDPQQRVFLELCVEALEDAGIDRLRYPGEIGLFAGSGTTTYLQNQLWPRPDVMDQAGAIPVKVGNEKDYLVTRVSHLLGLRGPSLAINTACSTGLVATAQAVQSLRSGESDVALAGGVTIHCPPRVGSLYQEGSMQSPDGYTRSFDVDSAGTSFNDGAAVVVLKCLSRALADGDQIWSVIRSVGVNNDGSDKMSFIAPSVSGQAAAIRKAHRKSGVDPRTISYVEAHGTATPIGDPIEVAALTAAFRDATPDRGFCALGTAKSNFGHTISAAGVMGLIKTSLALKHRILPATAHFTGPNPLLQLAETPFWVVGKTQPWAPGTGPRRAGVSSFGYGGTNAHAVVEEAPEIPGADEDSGLQVLVLSAQGPEALGQACTDLAAFLTKRPEAVLADVAFTLQTGRAELPWRTAVTCATVSEAVAALGSAARSAQKVVEPPKVVFLFPGQGSQYREMGLQLYIESPVFRAAFDECDAVIQPILGEGLLDVLSSGAEKLAQTRYTQPALFTVQYALARHWMSWGVTPGAALGHSVGEFVAASLAGIMAPADAARLVALRGQLVDSCAPGGMLAVRTTVEVLRELLPEGIEIAAQNAPESQVVAGERGRLQDFEKLLSAREIPCRNLNASHGFHSAMMDPVVARFEAEVAQVRLSAPRIPVVSTLTGTWLTAEEATDPAYWGRHMRRAVLFSQALQTLLAEPLWAFLEVGPQGTLTKLVLQHPAARGRTVTASLGETPESELQKVGTALGTLWKGGLTPDWTAVHQGRRRLHVGLPAYPFQRKRFWIEPNRIPLQKGTTAMPSNREPQLLQDLFQLLEDLSGQTFTAADAATDYAELGLDSLQLTQAAQNASKKFGVKLKLRDFVELYPSPARLVTYLATLVPGSGPVPAAPTPLLSPTPPAAAVPQTVFAAPQALSALVPAAGLEGLFQQQLDLMRQQLALLGGSSALVSPAPGPVVGPAPTPVPPPAADAPAGPVKGHGPQLVIDRTGKKELSPSQEKYLKSLQERYNAKTKKSKEFTQRNRAGVADPRAVAGFKPQLKEMVYPIVSNRSQGCHLWDIDGNEYIDILSGYGSNFFGFGADFVKEAMTRQMDIGMEIGPQAFLIEEVSQLFREFVPMDRIAFCNTGSEAVLAALRVTRTATGKDLVVMFSGGYHGIFDEVVVRTGGKGRSIPAAPGIPGASVDNILILDWADEASLEVIRQRADEIAAVITEPVQSRMPHVQPIEFLKKLRTLTKEHGIALIFDEVVTGFRSAPGGAQELFGIEADVATFGKVLGGGTSIGIVAGKKEFMDALDGGAWQFGDGSVPEVGVTYFAGTFVRHPLALAVTVAVLKELKKTGPTLYPSLAAKTARLAQRLNTLFEAEEAPVRLRHFTSIMKVDASHDVPFYELLFILLRLRGVHVWDGRPCFLTAAHTDADLDFVVQAFRESIAELQEGGFYPKPVKKTQADQPPVPGARLGKNQAGQPAWFVEDPKNPGQYLEWK